MRLTAFLWLLAVVTVNAMQAQQSPDDLVRRARDAAQHDRNAESAALFAQVIAATPERRPELLREYADQLTYSGHSRQAVPLFREVLQNPRLSNDDRKRARRGLALALSWSHQLRPALREYESLVHDDPGDIDSRLNYARVLSWLDQLGPARSAYEGVLARDPRNLEARRSLARISEWQGRPREAIDELTAILREHPDDGESRLLLADAYRSVGRRDVSRQQLGSVKTSTSGLNEAQDQALLDTVPVLDVEGQTSHQSDGLNIRTGQVEQSFAFRDGRTSFAPRLQYYFYDAPASKPEGDVTDIRPGLAFRNRFSQAVEINAIGYADQVNLDKTSQSYTTPTYDAWLTIWPSDFVRIDLSSNRTTFDNVTSLARNIDGVFVGGSMDITPTEKVRVTTRYNYGFYNDTNRRHFGQFEAERRFYNHPRLWAGYRATVMDFDRQLNNGYFNPDLFHSHAATFHAWDSFGKKFYYDFDGWWGYEFQSTGDNKPAWSVGSKLTYLFTSRLELQAHYNYFSSRLASSSGFARGTAGLSLHYRW